MSASASSYSEALEEGLLLSQTLGGVQVFGIWNGYIEGVVSALCNCWREFFSSTPEGQFIQYCHKDGMECVRQAFTRFSSEKITVVGIEPSILIDHRAAYYYGREGICGLPKKDKRIVLLRLTEKANGYIRWFTDSSFLECLQYPYYCLRESLQETVFSGRVSQEASRVAVGEGNQALALTCYAEKVFSERRINRERLTHVMDGLECCFRLIDYSMVLVANFSFIKRSSLRVPEGAWDFWIKQKYDYYREDPKPTAAMGTVVLAHSNRILSIFLISYWILYTVSQFILGYLKSRKLRIAALKISMAACLVNGLDLIDTIRLTVTKVPGVGQPRGLYPVLALYSTAFFFKVVVKSCLPALREKGYAIARKIVGEHMPSNTVQKDFFNTMQTSRTLLNLAYLLILSCFFLVPTVFSSDPLNVYLSAYHFRTRFYLVFNAIHSFALCLLVGIILGLCIVWRNGRRTTFFG